MDAEQVSQTRLRDRLPFPPRREPQFRWRGREVSRVEGFTDAVFAFAVTLLVVALEVPHTFNGLLDVVRGFPAFVICFAALMTFWNAHYTYHRRYGLDDAFSRVFTMAILVLVLFFVYPLKFLFTMLTVHPRGGVPVVDPAGHGHQQRLAAGCHVHAAGTAAGPQRLDARSQDTRARRERARRVIGPGRDTTRLRARAAPRPGRRRARRADRRAACAPCFPALRCRAPCARRGSRRRSN